WTKIFYRACHSSAVGRNRTWVNVHLARLRERSRRASDAGEGAWGVTHALSRRFAPTSPTAWARCTVCAHRRSPQPAKISGFSSTGQLLEKILTIFLVAL